MRRSAASASMVEFPDGIEHPILLRAREMLIHGKADHVPGVAVGHRKAPRGIAQVFQAFLLVERDRIVDFCLDTMVETVFVKLVTPLRENHVEMIDVLHVSPARRHPYAAYTGEAGIVIGGILDPPLGDVAGLADQPV